MRLAWWLVALAAAFAVLGGCDGEETEPSVLRVPEEHATIQLAVDRAQSGDLVLVSPGTYSEAVTVRTPGITVRGVDRNAVVLDGRHVLSTGLLVTASGVAIENLTVVGYVESGVWFDGSSGTPGVAVTGFRASYVTAANNGRHGIVASGVSAGSIERSLASGHPDSGIHVAQCGPCDIVVSDSVAENNAIGYSSTNASVSLFAIRSTFRGNRLGMLVRGKGTDRAGDEPSSSLVGNVVSDNDNPETPASSSALFGAGIVVGGAETTVLRNLVTGHGLVGIGLVELDGADPAGNRIQGNLLSGNGTDLYYELLPGTVSSFGNCFGGNGFATALPADIESVLPCDAPERPVVPGTLSRTEPPPGVDHRRMPLPAPQPSMPGEPDAPPDRRAGSPPTPDLDAIEVPTST